MAAFWDIALFSLIEVDQRFRGALCHSHQGDGVGMFRVWMTGICYSEMLVITCMATQCHNPEVHKPKFYHRERPKTPCSIIFEQKCVR